MGIFGIFRAFSWVFSMGRSKTEFKIDQSVINVWNDWLNRYFSFYFFQPVTKSHSLNNVRRNKFKKHKYQLAHRPITRSMTKNITEFSFCSIPLKKTNKKLRLKTESREQQISENHADKTPKSVTGTCSSSESMIVLFEGNQNLLFEDYSLCNIKAEYDLSTNYSELPSDLVDIKLDPLLMESGCGDFCQHSSNISLDLTEDDHKIIEESLKLMDDESFQERLIKRTSLTDNTIDNLINLYLIDENQPTTNSTKRRKH